MNKVSSWRRVEELAMNVVVLLQSQKGRRLVREKCEAAGLDMGVLEQLIDAELDYVGKLRKRGLRGDFDEIFSELDEEED